MYLGPTTVTAAPSSANRRPATCTGSLPISTTTVPSRRPGWDVSLSTGPYVLEILGLFDRSDTGSDHRTFSRKWADGSEARYGADAPDSSGTPPSEFSPYEAVLVLPGQQCGYRIYDSQGKAHLESVLDHLRFVQGAP